MASAKGSLRGFTNERQAYRAGQWISAQLLGNERAIRYCKDNGLPLNAGSVGVNTKGGFLAPTELSKAIIDLKEEYGVFGRESRVITMSSDAIAVTGFVVLFVLMLLRVPIGMAMGLVGVSGFAYLSGGGPALKIVGHTSMRTVTDFNFAVVPLFLLMGSFATTSGMSRELFRAGNAFLGHLRGGRLEQRRG